MKILILGSSGFTGRFFKNFFASKGAEVYGTYRTECIEYKNDSTMLPYDVEQGSALKELLQQCLPDVLISCLRGDFSRQLDAHKYLISYVKSINHGRLVFLSTSNVFDNDLSKAHVESDTPDASSDYGKYKAECEQLILEELGEKAIILRPSFIMGPGCRRSEAFFQAIQAGTPAVTYENIFFNYTSVKQLAEWLWYILEHDLDGIFHVGTKDICSYTEFLLQLAASLALPVPEFSVESMKETSYQAVIPARPEIPDNMQLTIQDMIALWTS